MHTNDLKWNAEDFKWGTTITVQCQAVLTLGKTEPSHRWYQVLIMFIMECWQLNPRVKLARLCCLTILLYINLCFCQGTY